MTNSIVWLDIQPLGDATGVFENILKQQQKVVNYKFELLKAVTMVEALSCTDLLCRNATPNGHRTCAKCQAVEHLTTLCDSNL